MRPKRVGISTDLIIAEFHISLHHITVFKNRTLLACLKYSQPCSEEYINKGLIKRELTNARVKKYRKKKCTESLQLNSSMQDDPAEEIQNKQVEENNAERKRAMAKEGSRRFREKKHLNVLKSCRGILSTRSFFY